MSVRKTLTHALANGDASAASNALEFYQCGLHSEIEIDEFNAARQGVIVAQEYHARTGYSPLQYAQTLLHQLDTWRHGEVYFSLGSPERDRLDQIIRDWQVLERTLLNGASLEQIGDHQLRAQSAREWNDRHANNSRYPAGYFIDLQRVFGWEHQTNYESEDEDEYLDPDGTSMYSKAPLKFI